MDYIARQGYDVYALDLRGYGHSSRPSEMSEPAADHPPLVTGDIGIQDITTAVDYILAKRNIDRINLLGWSWGTALMGKYASLNPARVARLVLYAPLWLFKPTLNGNDSSGLPAYRSVTQDETRERWLKGVPIEVQDTLIPPGWFESWADMTWATDEVGFKKIPPILRAPNGVLQDAMEYFLVGKPYYDPSKITAPTLVIGAEWDNETPPYMAQDLFKLLVNSPGKHHEELTKGTHSIIMEMNRLALFSAVQRFLT